MCSADATLSGVSDADLETAVRVLKAFTTPDGITEEYRSPRCKPLRVAIQCYLDDAHSRQFHGQKPDKYAQRKEKKREKNAKEQQQRALDRDAADKTRMRAERLKMLGSLEAEAANGDTANLSLTLVPDGAVDTHSSEHARIRSSTDGGDDDDDCDGGEVVASDSSDVKIRDAATELHVLRPCYTCKLRFRLMHHFYSQLCPTCAELNYMKRLQTADLSGRVFLLTGGRVKIGFQCALKLLRCGASVLVTSRFPADTAARFCAVADSSQWMPRLKCYGLDLRDLSSLERFCAHLIAMGQRLDGIINNACQTIRRPAAYYAHLLPFELQPDEWSPQVLRVLEDHQTCFGAAKSPRLTSRPSHGAEHTEPHPICSPDSGADPGGSGERLAPGETAAAPPVALTPTATAGSETGDLSSVQAMAASTVPSALWSQAPLWSAEEGVMQPDEGIAANFPVGVRDVNGQQLDTRRTNSWLLKLGDVSTPEAAEVLAINTLAPFILNSRLRCLLEACDSSQRFVVNVSAMEGKFYRYKTPNHPHTNMAKAALNMMTRTCAQELAAVGIYMNSVDTGWINDEKPLDKAAAHAQAHHFQTPLDEVDAASRVLDPVLCACNGEPPIYGKFIKDYEAVEW